MTANRLPISGNQKAVDAFKRDTGKRDETFYQGPSGGELASFPPKERWMTTPQTVFSTTGASKSSYRRSEPQRTLISGATLRGLSIACARRVPSP
jgi:hypothetical protein